MKKVVLISAIILLLSLVTFLVIKVIFTNNTQETEETRTSFPISPSVGSEATDPAILVQSFYDWYLLNAMQNPVFPYVENKDAILSDWLSADFVANWDLVQTELEANPVLLTADDTTSWYSNVQTALTSRSSYTSIVRVTILNTAPKIVFDVQLVRAPDSSWKIDSVKNAAY